MNNSNKIRLINAYDSTNNTGVLNSNQARIIAEQARSLARTDGVVAISMKGITSMSILTAVELCNEITKERGLAKKVAIVGSSPYISRIIGIGMRNTTRASIASGRKISAVSKMHN